jgi:hypothetical protein
MIAKICQLLIPVGDCRLKQISSPTEQEKFKWLRNKTVKKLGHHI